MDSHFVNLVQTVVENIQNNQRKQKNETKKFSMHPSANYQPFKLKELFPLNEPVL